MISPLTSGAADVSAVSTSASQETLLDATASIGQPTFEVMT
jgi:hypothetical protein